MNNCGYIIFIPSPPPPLCMTCSIEVELVGSVIESEAFVNESSNKMTEGSPGEMQVDESELPPMIQIPHTGSFFENCIGEIR